MYPKIICHMITSVDGRLIAERWTPGYDGKKLEDFVNIYFELHKKFDAAGWINGRKTVQRHYFPKTFDTTGTVPAVNPQTYIAPRETKSLMAVIDPMGKIFYEGNKIEGDNIVAILSEQVSDRYLEHLHDMNISYLFCRCGRM